MSLTNVVIMPGADYKAICNAVREKTGKTILLKSGEVAAAIRSISGNEPTALGNKLYTFGVVSDMHTPYGDGVTKTKQAISTLQNLGAEFIVCAGDLVNSANISELQTHANAVAEVATVPFYSCNGNHDVGFTDDNWNDYVGHPLDYVLEIDGDVFIFFSLASTSGYGEEKLEWLQEQFDRYAGRRIFLSMHFPLPGYSGLRPGTYYGFSSDSTEDDSILNMMLNVKNVVQFSGHTHFAFGAEETYDNINVIEFNFADCATVHIPSSNYPRTADNASVYTGMSHGYIADAYDNGLVLRAVDFITGALMDGYTYILPIKNSTTVESDIILVSAESISVNEGETATFTVSLGHQPSENVTLTLSTDANNVITLDKTELVFTPENYTTPQTVTITAAEDDDVLDGSSVVTVSGVGYTSKSVSVMVIDNDKTGTPDTPDVHELPNRLEWEDKMVATNGEYTTETLGFTTKPFAVDGVTQFDVFVDAEIPGSSSVYVYFYSSDTISAASFVSRTTLTKGEATSVTVPNSATYAIICSTNLNGITNLVAEMMDYYIYLVLPGDQTTVTAIDAACSSESVTSGVPLNKLPQVWVLATYSNGYQRYVSDYEISCETSEILPGDNTLTATHLGVSDTFIVVGLALLYEWEEGYIDNSGNIVPAPSTYYHTTPFSVADAESICVVVDSSIGGTSKPYAYFYSSDVGDSSVFVSRIMLTVGVDNVVKIPAGATHIRIRSTADPIATLGTINEYIRMIVYSNPHSEENL